jgi:hypothetical protein
MELFTQKRNALLKQEEQIKERLSKESKTEDRYRIRLELRRIHSKQEDLESEEEEWLREMIATAGILLIQSKYINLELESYEEFPDVLRLEFRKDKNNDIQLLIYNVHSIAFPQVPCLLIGYIYIDSFTKLLLNFTQRLTKEAMQNILVYSQ